MSFKVVINGDEVYEETERLVKAVSVVTRGGEKSRARIAGDDGVVYLNIETDFEGGSPDLDALEARRIDERRKATEGAQIGLPTATKEDIKAETKAREDNNEPEPVTEDERPYPEARTTQETAGVSGGVKESTSPVSTPSPTDAKGGVDIGLDLTK